MYMEPESNINQITLECLINKNCYNKYLINHDKVKYDALEEHFNTIKKHREKIMNIFTSYLDERDCQVNGTLDELFSNFVKAAIQHIEFKESENNNKYYNDYETENDDEDTLFGNMSDDPVASFWGKGAKKL